jgi:hypothetical protein
MSTDPRGDARFGAWAALATSVTMLVTFAMAVTTPPKSGPMCTSGCVEYPYTAIADRFPRDYAWMIPALVAFLAVAAFAVALAARARPSRRLLAHTGLAFALMATLTLVGNYAVQLAVVPPSVRAGEHDGLAMLSQYNPNGVFIALEELGYLLLSMGLGSLALALPATSRAEKVARGLLVGGLGVNLLVLVGVALLVESRSYYMEIAVISVTFLATIPAAALLAVVFRRALR